MTTVGEDRLQNALSRVEELETKYQALLTQVGTVTHRQGFGGGVDTSTVVYVPVCIHALVFSCNDFCNEI